jgi:hypothetical protein
MYTVMQQQPLHALNLNLQSIDCLFLRKIHQLLTFFFQMKKNFQNNLITFFILLKAKILIEQKL